MCITRLSPAGASSPQPPPLFSLSPPSLSNFLRSRCPIQPLHRRAPFPSARTAGPRRLPQPLLKPGQADLDLNRGNLRQKDWQHVADLVNARHGHTKKTYRTDVQCKNRIDTIKKKYKVEKARVSASPGMLSSSWPFYERLDELIGSNLKKPPAPPAAASVTVSDSLSHSPPMALPLPFPYRKSAPLATAVLPKKRASPMDDSYFRRNYSAVAAAAAAAATADDDEDDEEVEEEDEEDDLAEGFRGDDESEDGIRKLARAIRKFGDVYEKVEAEKQNQMIEMEKQRMQLAKDLEVQRMQMFVNMQLQLKKIKIAKGNKSNGESI